MLKLFALAAMGSHSLAASPLQRLCFRWASGSPPKSIKRMFMILPNKKSARVTDLMIDSNGNVAAAIISVSSGFLGVNQKDVVIPFKELKLSTRDGKNSLVLNRTKDELTTAPAYNNTGAPSDYRNR